MKGTIISCLAIGLLLFLLHQAEADKPERETDRMNFQEIVIALVGSTEIQADYFAGESERAVILAPGAMFKKESWHFLAKRFQEMGFSSIALNSGSTLDLLNGLEFLKTKGALKITIIGASAGGAGVLYTLENTIDPLVDSVVLLAPAGGLPIQNDQVKKLFIVAEDDKVSSNGEVYKLYMNSSNPKIYREITGSEHAQHLFKSRQREDIIQLIIRFIEK